MVSAASTSWGPPRPASGPCVRQAAEAVLEHEAGTLVYACSEVEAAPDQRLFFELYADRAAFDQHGRQPHVRHFLSESKNNAERTEIDRLRPYAGKYTFT
ncbi:putative quinol monooxygenase [Streptomyces sp. NPDC004296]|uniref:putative quinol monooxygenase n=1 Tax=Streptomyces sp. NPDC004296 TaxID=3364697 RepID=UPI0036C1900B